MADSITANYDLVKPEVGASNQTWGGKLNANADEIDALMAAMDPLMVAAKTTPVLADKIPLVDTETDPDVVKTITLTQLKALLQAAMTLSDAIFELADDSDATKKLKFQLSGITTAVTRTLTVPNMDGTIALIAGAQTFADKTLTQPIITLKQGAAEAPTAEGDIRWDSDDDHLVIGTGAATKTFFPVPASLADGDIFMVSGTGKTLSRIAKGTALQHLRMNAAATALEYTTVSDWPGVYNGSDGSNVDFPIGTYVMANNDSGTARNATATIRLGSGGADFDTAGAGAVLTGTWRARGSRSNMGGSGDQAQQLFQRTA